MVAQKLTRHLLREIVACGAEGGPLLPLASQLNHDQLQLEGEQIKGMIGEALERLAWKRLQEDKAITGCGHGCSQKPDCNASGGHLRLSDLAGWLAGALEGTRTPNLLIRSSMCGHPDRFSSVRDLGCVLTRCSSLSRDPGKSFVPVAPSVAPSRPCGVRWTWP